jgi:hypothetical protein
LSPGWKWGLTIWMISNSAILIYLVMK